MPSTLPKRVRDAKQVQPESIDDLEIKEVRPRQPRQKEVDVAKIVTNTLTDKIAATAAFTTSNNMLKTVGRDYAITPKEALNVYKPALLIIEHFLPVVSIKNKFPADIANNVETIIVTLAEYVSRVLAVFVEKQFHVTLAAQGVVARQTMPVQPQRKSSEVLPVDVDESPDISDLPLENMVRQEGQPIKQTSPGPTGFNFEELIADGVIVGDNGNNYA